MLLLGYNKLIIFSIYIQTNTNKLISGALLASVLLVSGVSAATIGTGSVVGSGGLTSSVVWNDT
ncbi:hypothetical protein H7170_03445, partial [Candidatus Gracilibacteria bacterium]|nr:hypothetical protein [Candidatus Gracilibacteria bacterium]